MCPFYGTLGINGLMEESNQLTPLSTLCKQPGPINWIPLLLSLVFPFSITSFSLINLILTMSYANTTSKISKRKVFCAMKYTLLKHISCGYGEIES